MSVHPASSDSTVFAAKVEATSSDRAATSVRRRSFVGLVTGVLSFLLVAIPSALGGLFFLDPLLRKRRAAGGSGDNAGAAHRKDDAGFIRLDVSADVIPEDGTPVAVTVRDDFDDAWNRFLDVPVGSIWMRKNPDGSIVAFNSVCPHLGCSVDYRRGENDFFCPCHTSSFALDGTKTNQIPPRNMDSLEVVRRTDGRDDLAGSELWVRFMNFRRTTAEKIPL